MFSIPTASDVLQCWYAGSPSKIPWSTQGQTSTLSNSRSKLDQRDASSSLMSQAPSPSPEVKQRAGVNIQFLTPPASAKIKHEHFFKGKEGWGLGHTTVPLFSTRTHQS